MNEKYFITLVFLLFGVSLILPLVAVYLKIKLKNLQKLTRLRIMKRQQKSEIAVLFASEILNECCKILFYDFSRRAGTALAYLVAGKIQKAADYLKTTHPQLSLLAEAHYNAEKAYKKILRQKSSWLKNNEYSVYVPLLANLLFDTLTAHSAIVKINPVKLNKGNRAYYNFCAANCYLFDGDMLSASQKASQALEYFKQKKYSHEGSECYLLLGEIYRVSCVNDVAQTMIEAAVKINKEQKMKQYLAKSTAALGMLMLFENRHSEAEDKYEQALLLAASDNLRADINNQKALLFIAQNRLKEAQKAANHALEIFGKFNNLHGEAFSLQLLAQIYFNKKQYKNALKAALKATEIYALNHNHSAMLECMYLSADILFRQSKTKQSEDMLRKIIEADKKQKHNFHIANAYSLLGLIYLRKNNLQRAKVLLQQSLHLEQRHRRCEGLVSDYANLAIIDVLSGNRDSAEENMQTALEYAKETGNQELCDLIEEKQKNIKSKS